MIGIENTTGSDRIDQGLRETIAICEQRFPGYIRSYYLTGSYADGSAVEESDVDFEVIFKQGSEDIVLEEARNLSGSLKDGDSPGGFSVRLEGSLKVLHIATLRLNSLFLYGEDIRDDLKMPDIEDYARETIPKGVQFSWIRVRGRSFPAHVPMSLPDPNEEFLGYFRTGNTKGLVQALFWGATGILAARHGEYVKNRSHVVELWKTRVTDHWADYLGEVHQVLRNDLRYRIPVEEDDRRRVRSLCERALAFEDYSAEQFRTFLKKERQSSNPQAEDWVARCERESRFHSPD